MTTGRWYQLGGIAGIGYVVAAAIAMVLTGFHPPPAASSEEVREFFVEKHASLTAQGWLIALGAALLLWFAVTLRGVLRAVPGGRKLGDVFFVGTAVAAGLSLVAMAIQIVMAKAASRLTPEAVRVVGFDFVLAQYLLCGFIVASAALAYGLCVFRGAGLPRWTAWLAIVAAVMNFAGTLCVFVPYGALSVVGNVVVWLPGFATTVWYFGAAVALLGVGRIQPPTNED
ncbi:hypothetical protein [Mycolicibacterium tusciae]|uniref:DUF4386 domain-containing protein n=1 Tax=Mycolicibacterium tusciae TaxID=75922 RepID=A0A1X0JNX7_9MYCO|nr:hypothetical protein [Mycolicibacterium tusciae]ORB64275.1 hypothetical protein BST47_16960 [Mycolicibacterium tusciae]